jgi:hypothetical protein
MVTAPPQQIRKRSFRIFVVLNQDQAERLYDGAETEYYVVAGLAWVLPAMPIISWMSRPDA